MKSGKTYQKVSSVSFLFGIRIGTALFMDNIVIKRAELPANTILWDIVKKLMRKTLRS